MNLLFFKGNKPDTRSADYDRKVVQLGLQKAALDSDVEKRKRDLKNLDTACAIVRSVFLRNYDRLTDEEKKEVQDKQKTIFDFDLRIDSAKKDLERMTEARRVIEEKLANDGEKFLDLSALITAAEVKRDHIENEIVKLAKQQEDKQKEMLAAGSARTEAVKKLDAVAAEVRSYEGDKIILVSDIENAKKELEELTEIISILKVNNKEGLDITASFEGERKRLQAKEEKLDTMRHDLVVYAQRLQVEREKLGIKTPMVLPIHIDGD